MWRDGLDNLIRPEEGRAAPPPAPPAPPPAIAPAPSTPLQQVTAKLSGLMEIPGQIQQDTRTAVDRAQWLGSILMNPVTRGLVASSSTEAGRAVSMLLPILNSAETSQGNGNAAAAAASTSTSSSSSSNSAAAGQPNAPSVGDAVAWVDAPPNTFLGQFKSSLDAASAEVVAMLPNLSAREHENPHNSQADAASQEPQREPPRTTSATGDDHEKMSNQEEKEQEKESSNGERSRSVRAFAKAHVQHWGICCDGCGSEPLMGIRCQCLSCECYDLCFDCFESRDASMHPVNHPFKVLVFPEQKNGNDE